MAIDLGSTSTTIGQKSVTWRFQADTYSSAGARIPDPVIEIFRGVLKTFGDTNIFRPSLTPIKVKASELPSLAEFAEVPPELASLIPDQASLVAHLATLPLLVAMACDAAERREQAAQEAEAERPPQEPEA